MVAEEAAGRLQAGAAAAAARRRLQEALRLARMKAEETHPRAEEEAVAQWVLLMLARRWRWRTAQKREVGMVGGTCRTGGHA